jgi:hypothetical protein
VGDPSSSPAVGSLVNTFEFEDINSQQQQRELRCSPALESITKPKKMTSSEFWKDKTMNLLIAPHNKL